jgi:hypothetical protein
MNLSMYLGMLPRGIPRRLPALVLLGLIAGIGTAQADIRITDSHFQNGTLVVSGETEPGNTVTLDNRFKTKADGGGHFTFHVNEKPDTCMSDIRSGADIYSAVISGCFGAVSSVPLQAPTAPARNAEPTPQ